MICDDCEEDCDDAVETICPYFDAILNETVPLVLCECCYEERRIRI